MARRKKQNEYPYFVPSANGTGTLSTGTADADVIALLAPAADFAIGRSLVKGSTNGTGTALITVAWYTQAARGGLALSGSHLSPAGTVYDLDAASGVMYAADGTGSFASGDFSASPTNDAMFINLDFDGGTATGAGTFRASLMVIL